MTRLPETTMSSEEDLSCSLCCYRYCRSKRLPRVLHCNHTFCTVCLERISSLCGIIYTARCPMCRWTTCTPSMLKLNHYLLINTDIWDLITNETEPLWVTEEAVVKKDASPPPKRRGLKAALQRIFGDMKPLCGHGRSLNVSVGPAV